MASFGWKRSRKSGLTSLPADAFTSDEDAADDEAATADHELDWLTATKKRKGLTLEDNEAKSKRLENEGVLLAENER